MNAPRLRQRARRCWRARSNRLVFPGRPQFVGFSLLEVLIALGLTVVLMAAVYSAIGLYYRFSTVSRGEIARAQVYRALVRRMNADFASIVMQLPQAAATTDQPAAETSSLSGSSSLSGGAGSGGSTSSTSESTTDSPLTVGGIAEGGVPPTFGLVGSNTFFHLTVSQPARDLAYSSVFGDDVGAGRSSDLLTITYGLAPVTPAILANPTPEAISRLPAQGFGRRLMDLYSPYSAPDTLGPEHLLAPEISEIQVRYFDGVAWLDSWDSRTTQTLPRAVEVTFGFFNPPEINPGTLQLFDVGSVTSVNHTFAIPMSTPATGEASL